MVVFLTEKLKLRQSNVAQEANAVINMFHDYTQFHSCNRGQKFQYHLSLFFFFDLKIIQHEIGE